MGNSTRLIYSIVAIVILVVVIVGFVILLCTMNRRTKRHTNKQIPVAEMPMTDTYVLDMGIDETSGGQAHYTVNGNEHGTIQLQRGKKYRILLQKGCHPLYITSSPIGGPDLPGSLDKQVTKKGIVSEGNDMFIVIPQDAEPGTLYYQSTLQEGVGGKIVID